MSEIIRDEKDPQHWKWQQLFSPYTWFYSSEKTYVLILARYSKAGGTEIDKLEVLKQDQERPVLVDYLVFFKSFQAGQLRRTSTF